MKTQLSSIMLRARNGAATGLCLLGAVSVLLCAFMGRDLRVIRVDTDSGSQYRLELGMSIGAEVVDATPSCQTSCDDDATSVCDCEQDAGSQKSKNRQTLVQSGFGHCLEVKSYKVSPISKIIPVTQFVWIPEVPAVDVIATIPQDPPHFCDSPPPPSRAPPSILS